ncbi:unnamed protein product [Haemonchus placei]|uniref:Col_cuticle_N domain-containing protein n=1 Tax=Haemonchus placei TaxID=6290 RepID=A0A0N4WSK1_HAEPC|nr:unnamed protein product [Haemonchus placei]
MLSLSRAAMFAFVVGGASTFMQLWRTLLNVSTTETLVEFEKDTDQLTSIEMEEHEMWSKRSSQRESTQIRNNSASVLAVTLTALAIVMWTIIL